VRDEGVELFGLLAERVVADSEEKGDSDETAEKTEREHEAVLEKTVLSCSVLFVLFHQLDHMVQALDLLLSAWDGVALRGLSDEAPVAMDVAGGEGGGGDGVTGRKEAEDDRRRRRGGAEEDDPLGHGHDDRRRGPGPVGSQAFVRLRG